MMQLLPAVLPTLCHIKHMGVSVILLIMYEGYEYYSIHNVIESYEFGTITQPNRLLTLPHSKRKQNCA
jgi:hypothetical protein